jgi:ADP-L-glycero-D-manno-heptose 6-epimerase
LCGLKFTDIYHKTDFYNRVVEENLPFDLDAIIHMGACSSTTETDADYLLNNNYRYTLELVKYALPRKIRFVNASSAATYGDGSNGYDDNEDRLDELKPLNMYGYSKHLFDLWARRMGIIDKIAGLKFFNVYGPNESHKEDMRSVVNKAFEQISGSGKLKLFKSYKPDYQDGEQLRDFIYVKDAVDIVLYFLENKEKNGLFNVGTGKARTWNDLAGCIFNSMYKPQSIEYIDMPDTLSDKYQYYTQATVDKLRKAGYKKEFYSLEDGVDDYVKNYLVKGKRLGE